MAMSLNSKRVVVFLMGLALCTALILVADQERRKHAPDGRPAVYEIDRVIRCRSRVVLILIRIWPGPRPGIGDGFWDMVRWNPSR